MKRLRSYDGRWGYCSHCGNKAYERPGTGHALCADECGYIEQPREILYSSNNTTTIGKDVLMHYLLESIDWDSKDRLGLTLKIDCDAAEMVRGILQ